MSVLSKGVSQRSEEKVAEVELLPKPLVGLIQFVYIILIDRDSSTGYGSWMLLSWYANAC